jgi:hypothetical protein
MIMNQVIKNAASVVRAICVAGMCFAAAGADASVITVETGTSKALAQATGAAYESVVEAAIAVPTVGYGKKTVAKFDNLTNHALFPSGASQYIATKYTVDFVVDSSNAGQYQFRFGTDFGQGGAVFVDNVQVALNKNDMWWGGAYTNTAQYFLINPTLLAGAHTIEIFGLDNCCDGYAQGQFKSAKMASFMTLSSTDGMSPAIPEPSSVALLGLGIAGLIAMRKKAA